MNPHRRYARQQFAQTAAWLFMIVWLVVCIAYGLWTQDGTLAMARV